MWELGELTAQLHDLIRFRKQVVDALEEEKEKR